jgi:hypothetical protein
MTVEFYKHIYKNKCIVIYKVINNIVYSPYYSVYDKDVLFCLITNVSRLTLFDLIKYEYDFLVCRDYIKEFLESL